MNLPPLTPELRDRYTSADPFPHLVLDGVFGTDLCARAASEYPPPDDPSWHTFSGPLEHNKQEGRASIASDGVAQLHYFLARPSTVEWIEDLTGVEKLMTDPDRVGGGIHQVREDGRLALHTDFRIHPVHPEFERRVNVLLFVSDAPWLGAELVLYREGHTPKSIVPRADRMVIFPAEDGYYHGHPTPMQPPTPLDVRRSLPAYFYAPRRADVVARSTTFLEGAR